LIEIDGDEPIEIESGSESEGVEIVAH